MLREDVSFALQKGEREIGREPDVSREGPPVMARKIGSMHVCQGCVTPAVPSAAPTGITVARLEMIETPLCATTLHDILGCAGRGQE